VRRWCDLGTLAFVQRMEGRRSVTAEAAVHGTLERSDRTRDSESRDCGGGRGGAHQPVAGVFRAITQTSVGGGGRCHRVYRAVIKFDRKSTLADSSISFETSPVQIGRVTFPFPRTTNRA